MRIGVVFPQTELGGDVGAVRAYGEAVEALGYTHLLAYDHVVGADPAVHTGWAGAYDVSTTFHEPFVMFGYLAALTSLELVTGIIILPQRQTALVAKQAAEVDLLTGGPLPARRGPRMEPGRVRGPGPALRRAWPSDDRADPGAPPTVDRDVDHPRGHVRHDHRRRHRTGADPTTDPDLDRGRVRARLPAHWPARRRMVPPDPTGRETAASARDHRRRRTGGRSRRRIHRHGTARDLDADRPRPVCETRSRTGDGWARPISASTRCRRVRRRSTNTSPPCNAAGGTHRRIAGIASPRLMGTYSAIRARAAELTGRRSEREALDRLVEAVRAG